MRSNLAAQVIEKKAKCFSSMARTVSWSEIGRTGALRKRTSESNMLEARFAVAPMMDWTDSPEK
jgi:hypothetical protein